MGVARAYHATKAQSTEATGGQGESIQGGSFRSRRDICVRWHGGDETTSLLGGGRQHDASSWARGDAQRSGLGSLA